MTIRLARRDDIAAIDALLARSYPRQLKRDYPPSVMVTALPLISRAQPALVKSGSYFVAKSSEGEIIGAGGWTPRRGGQIGDIRHLVTDDRQLRKGVARRIIEAVHAQARAKGIRLMDCKATYTAEKFYSAMGYHRLRNIEVELRPGIVFPAIQMERELT